MSYNKHTTMVLCLNHCKARKAQLMAVPILQDIDVETLMQEIKHWGPQDPKPAGDAVLTHTDSQTPRRLSLDQADDSSASPGASPEHSPTPEHAGAQVPQRESSSSSDKVLWQSDPTACAR